MGLSFKELATSTYGKVLTGALTLGAGSAMTHDAEAAEITTITQSAAKLCIGSDIAGTIYGEQLGWKGILTDGKSTGFSTTDNLVIQDQMDNPNSEGDYLIGTHRNFAYTRWFANNGMVEGYYLYNIGDVNNIKQSFIINSKNYPDYTEGIRIHFVKGATPDQDQMIFLGNTLHVYKSPFDATGKVKPECKTGPIAPDFTYKINFPFTDIRAVENLILCTTTGTNPMIHKLIITKNSITEDPMALTLNGAKSYGWSPIDNGFIATKDANGISMTYLTVIGGGSKIKLVDINNLSNNEQTDAVDIAVEDPNGRYAFKSIEDGVGNLDTYVTDLWAKPQVNKKIITNNIWPLRGNLSYADGLPTPAWILYGKSGNNGTKDKAYLIELLDPATMNFKVTEAPFTTFKNNYAGGGEACVTIPGQVATVVKNGTPADAGDASVVESANEGAAEMVEVVEAVEAAEVVEKDVSDAGTTEVDGVGADVVAEVVVNSDVDAIDGSVDDTITDMSDTYPEVTVTKDGEQDTTSDQSSADTVEAATAAEVDGEVTPLDMSKNETVPPTDIQSKDNTDTDDTAVIPVDIQKVDGNDTTVDAWLAGDVVDMKDIFTDAASTETSRKPPVIAPAPKDTGCNATGNGNNGLTPLTIALGVAAMVGLARKREG